MEGNVSSTPSPGMSAEEASLVGSDPNGTSVATPSGADLCDPLSEEEVALYMIVSWWFECLLQCLVGAVGFLANALAVPILCSREMNTIFNRLLVFLSVFDNFYIVCSVLEGIRKHTPFSQTHELAFGTFLYQLHNFVLCCSIYTTLTLALERYRAVWRPVEYHNKCKGANPWVRVAHYLVPVLIFSAVFNIPKFLEVEFVVKSYVMNETDPETGEVLSSRTMNRTVASPTDLRLNDNYVIFYVNAARLLVQGIIPFVLLTILNYRIHWVIKRRREMINRPCNNNRSNSLAAGMATVSSTGGAPAAGSAAVPIKITSAQRKANETQQAVVLFFIVLLFFICHTPRFVLNVHEFLTLESLRKSIDHDCNDISLWALICASVSHFLMTLNCSVNFFIYCFMCATFRKILSRLFRRALYRALCFFCCWDAGEAARGDVGASPASGRGSVSHGRGPPSWIRSSVARLASASPSPPTDAGVTTGVHPGVLDDRRSSAVVSRRMSPQSSAHGEVLFLQIPDQNQGKLSDPPSSPPQNALSPSGGGGRSRFSENDTEALEGVTSVERQGRSASFSASAADITEGAATKTGNRACCLNNKPTLQSLSCCGDLKDLDKEELARVDEKGCGSEPVEGTQSSVLLQPSSKGGSFRQQWAAAAAGPDEGLVGSLPLGENETEGEEGGGEAEKLLSQPKEGQSGVGGQTDDSSSAPLRLFLQQARGKAGDDGGEEGSGAEAGERSLEASAAGGGGERQLENPGELAKLTFVSPDEWEALERKRDVGEEDDDDADDGLIRGRGLGVRLTSGKEERAASKKGGGPPGFVDVGGVEKEERAEEWGARNGCQNDDAPTARAQPPAPPAAPKRALRFGPSAAGGSVRALYSQVAEKMTGGMRKRSGKQKEKKGRVVIVDEADSRKEEGAACSAREKIEGSGGAGGGEGRGSPVAVTKRGEEGGDEKDKKVLETSL